MRLLSQSVMKKNLRDNFLNKSKPLISIITLSHNCENQIRNTLESLDNQTYKDFEIIFQDALSIDSTLDKIASKKDCFQNYQLFSERDSGIYDGLNKAIHHANGYYIGVLHSNDVFYSDDILKKISKKLEDKTVDVLYGDIEIFSQKNNKVVRKWHAGKFTRFKLFFGWMPPHTSMFAKKSLINEIGGYRTDLKIASDYDLILKMFRLRSIKINYFPEVIVRMPLGGISTSGVNSLFKNTKEDFLVLTSHFGISGLIALVGKKLMKLTQFNIFSLFGKKIK